MGSQKLQTQLSPLLWSHTQTLALHFQISGSTAQGAQTQGSLGKKTNASHSFFPVTLDSTRILGKQSFLASTSL